jgi:hypothetical protein
MTVDALHGGRRHWGAGLRRCSSSNPSGPAHVMQFDLSYRVALALRKTLDVAFAYLFFCVVCQLLHISASMPPRKKQRTAVEVAALSSAASSCGAAAIHISRRYLRRLNPPPPHQRLHRHALESIFSFLSFN